MRKLVLKKSVILGYDQALQRHFLAPIWRDAELAPRKMDSVPCVGPGVAVRDPEGSLNLD